MRVSKSASSTMPPPGAPSAIRRAPCKAGVVAKKRAAESRLPSLPSAASPAWSSSAAWCADADEPLRTTRPPRLPNSTLDDDEADARKNTPVSVELAPPGTSPPPYGDALEAGTCFAEAEWENELARQILVLSGAAIGSALPIRGRDRDFALDDDDVVQVPPNEATRTHCAARLAQREAHTRETRKAASQAKAQRRRKGVRPVVPVVGTAADDANTSGVAAPSKARRPILEAKVLPIWFLGSGDLCAEWGALPEGDALVDELGALEEAGQYEVYVARVEASLNAYARHLDDDAAPEPGALFGRLWRQLAVTANVFGVRCVESRRLSEALTLFKKAEELAACPETLPAREMAELRAFVDDSHAFYYYRRAKNNAALVYAQRAMKVHARLKQWPHVAKSHLHSAAVLSRLHRHPEAIRCLGQVLHLVHTERLDQGGAAPHKLCLVAVCYHNLAVEQITIHRPSEALVSAQNARRLARLCLSFSNRWLHYFEQTHRCATLHHDAAQNAEKLARTTNSTS